MLPANSYNKLNYYRNFKEASYQAIQSQKLLMLFEVQEGCEWCLKQAEQTLIDTRVKKAIKQSFLPLLLKVDSDLIPVHYNTHVLPAIYFINPNENEEVWRAVGYKTVLQLLKIFDKAKESYAEDLEDEEGS